MAAINESGKKIVDIISVIDGIAFQKRIFWRSMPPSKGAAAAKEIKSLIGDSAEKTNNGRRLVGHTGETMAEIVESVKRVTDIMSAIAAASLQQGSGIGQVNDAVSQMDRGTQQNATLVEEIAALALTLEERADGLVEAVSVFTLTGEAGRSSKRAAAVVVASHSAAAIGKKSNRPIGSGGTRTVMRPPAASTESSEDGCNSF